MMVQLTGMWLNESASGEKYMKGKLNGNDVLLFKNKHKTEDKHPDYVLYLAPYQKREEEENPFDGLTK